MTSKRPIYCTGCHRYTDARLTNGREVYPRSPDLRDLPFWKCDDCGNFVGCHHKTDTPTQPLGCIPTPQIKSYRQKIHAVIDPIWISGKWKRKAVYKAISDKLGRKYHTAEIRSVDEAKEVLRIAKELEAAS